MDVTYKPPRFVIPVKVAIVITTLVSTGVSLIAGYLLYSESVSMLEATVEEQSAVLSRTSATRFRSLFKDHVQLMDFVERYSITKPGDTLDNMEELSHAIFSNLRSFPQMYGAGIRIFPKYREGMNVTKPWDNPEGHAGMWTWYDPLLDKDTHEYDPEDRQENKMYLNALGHARLGVVDGIPHLNLRENALTSLNMVCAELNKTTGRHKRHVYVSEEASVKSSWDAMMSGKTIWTDPYFWFSLDNTPYSYMIVIRGGITPAFAPDHDAVFVGYMALKTWESYILDYANGEDTMFIVNGELGTVFAHTLFVAPAMRPGCYTQCVFECETADGADGDCGLPTSYFGPTLQSAVNKAMAGKIGEFRIMSLPSTHRRVLVRFGEYFADTDVNQTNPIPKIHKYHEVKMEGGEWFTRFSEVYSYQRLEDVGRVEVLWMRPVSSVKDKVFAALVQLILCSATIFVMDALIAIAELLLLARPLAKLAKSITYIEVLDLARLNEILDGIYTTFGASEVVRLISGIKYAAGCLADYKAHLPGNLFLESDDESEDSDALSGLDQSSRLNQSSRMQSSRVSGSLVSRRVAANRPMISAVGLNPAKGVVLTIELPTSTAVTDRASDVISVVESSVSITHGVLHSFGAADVVLSATWNILTKRDASILKSVRAASAIRRDSNVTLALSLSFASLKAGNLGSTTTKGFALGGDAMINLQLQRSYTRFLSLRATSTIVLVGNSIFVDTQTLFDYYAVGFVSTGERKLPMHSLGEEKAQQNEEWMYAMANDEESKDGMHEAYACKTDNGKAELLSKVETTDPAQKWFIADWISANKEGLGISFCYSFGLPQRLENQ